jgi:hypothetical protein
VAARWALIGVVGLACAVVGFFPLGRDEVPVTFAPPVIEKPLEFPDDATATAFRDAALRRAKVWRPTNPAAIDLGDNPPDPTGALSEAIVRCRFLPREAKGTTPKFRCALSDGEVVKVKYGDLTGEIHAELAASRLLRALGFGADSMFLIRRLRCYGCPPAPFETTWVLDHVGAREALTKRLPDDRYSEFEWVSVEQRFPGVEIRAGDREGWSWDELERVDPTAGGASRAQIDALRLIAVFLSHWDNKAENQRLVCQSPLSEDSVRCDRPFALMQDLGASFGPNKMSLEHWRQTPIWADASQCRVSMSSLPYSGATFKDVTIGEAGRALLARQLQALSDDQVTALFNGARFSEFKGILDRAAPVSDWVNAFDDKVRQIANAGPCPVTSSSPTPTHSLSAPRPSTPRAIERPALRP